MTLLIEVSLHSVTIEGRRLPRPRRVSVKQWLDFWEDVDARPDHENDAEIIEDLKLEIEELTARCDSLQADLDSVDRT